MTKFIALLVCISALATLTMSVPAHAARNLDKNLGWPGTSLTGVQCKGKPQGFGPFDYTDKTYSVDGRYRGHGSDRSPLSFVEGAHFLRKTERLISGKATVDPMGDIDYTLRAFPNHHRALYAMVRYYLRELPHDRRDEPPNKFSPFIRNRPPPECYFQRARYFAPEDGMVPALFGLYLHRRNDLDGALTQYQEAEKLIGPYAEYYYNRGLLHFDRGEYSEAQKYADKAYQMNYQLPGLRRKLDRVKQQASGKQTG